MGVADGAVFLYDLRSGPETGLLPVQTGEDSIQTLAFGRDGTTLACGLTNGLVEVWNTATSKRLARFAAHDPVAVLGLAHSPTADLLVTGCGESISGGDDPLGTDRATRPEGAAPVHHHGGVRLWEMPAGRLRWSRTGGQELFAYAAAFAADGQSLVTAGKRLLQWSVATGESKEVPGSEDDRDPGETARSFGTAAFSPDGQLLAAERSRVIDLVQTSDIPIWEVPDGRLVSKLRPLDRFAVFSSICFSPDGKLMAAGGPDGDEAVTIWTLEGPATSR